MALVVAVVVEAAALRGEGADEVGVCDVCFLEVAPEEGAPAALVWSVLAPVLREGLCAACLRGSSPRGTS